MEFKMQFKYIAMIVHACQRSQKQQRQRQWQQQKLKLNRQHKLCIHTRMSEARRVSFGKKSEQNKISEDTRRRKKTFFRIFCPFLFYSLHMV